MRTVGTEETAAVLLNRKQLINIGDAKKLWFVKRGVRKVGGYEDDPVTINSTQPSLVEKHITDSANNSTTQNNNYSGNIRRYL